MLLVIRVVIVISVASDVPDVANSASDRYQQIARSDGLPYRDVDVEYAPGELLIALLVGSSSGAAAVTGLAVIAFASDVTAWLAIRKGWGRATSLRYLWLGVPLLTFIYRRADLFTVALTVVALVLARRGKPRSGGVAMAVSTLTRFWPVVLTPIWLIERKTKALTVFVASTMAAFIAWMSFGGLDAIRQVSTFRGATGWELESSVGVVVWMLTGEHRMELDANRTGMIPAWWGPVALLVLVGLLALVWSKASRRAADPAGMSAVAAISVLLLMSPVLSPQYIAWLVPWAAIAGDESPRWSWAAAIPIAITGALALGWALHTGLGPERTQLALLGRNLAIVGLVVTFAATGDPAVHGAKALR